MSHSRSAVSTLNTFASATSRQTIRVRSSILANHTAAARRAFTTTMAPWKPNSDIPKHEMVYFPQMTTSLPSESGEFRRVLWTGLYSQLVLMTVPVGGDIGDEVCLPGIPPFSAFANRYQKHTVDQILTFTSGTGKATIAGKDQDVKAGDLIIVPAGTQHQFVNTGPNPLILYTVYSPAEHKPTTVHKTKEQGDQEEEDGIDVAPDWARKSKAENEKAGLVEGE